MTSNADQSNNEKFPSILSSDQHILTLNIPSYKESQNIENTNKTRSSDCNADDNTTIDQEKNGRRIIDSVEPQTELSSLAMDGPVEMRESHGDNEDNQPPHHHPDPDSNEEILFEIRLGFVCSDCSKLFNHKGFESPSSI